jgi:hypothetical protein
MHLSSPIVPRDGDIAGMWSSVETGRDQMEQTEKDLESLSGASSLSACPYCRLHDARPLAMVWSRFTIAACCTTICKIIISASAAKHALYDGQLLFRLKCECNAPTGLSPARYGPQSSSLT